MPNKFKSWKKLCVLTLSLMAVLLLSSPLEGGQRNTEPSKSSSVLEKNETPKSSEPSNTARNSPNDVNVISFNSSVQTTGPDVRPNTPITIEWTYLTAHLPEVAFRSLLNGTTTTFSTSDLTTVGVVGDRTILRATIPGVPSGSYTARLEAFNTFGVGFMEATFTAGIVPTNPEGLRIIRTTTETETAIDAAGSILWSRTTSTTATENRQ